MQSSSEIITTNKPTTSFLQAGCPSCRPTNSVKALKGKFHIPGTCLSQTHLGSSNFSLLPQIAPGYLGGGLPCLSSALWFPYGLVVRNSEELFPEVLKKLGIMKNLCFGCENVGCSVSQQYAWICFCQGLLDVTVSVTICGDACPLSCVSAEAYKLAQCTGPQGWGS